MRHTITREISIDMGHRVTHHGSKCRNLHGHRYTIFAECVGGLFNSGEQEGMVLDFGFLKEEMMEQIDSPCDHGMCLWVDDPLLDQFLKAEPHNIQLEVIRAHVKADGFWLGYTSVGKTYVVPFVPTAENLAKHWYERLLPRVKERTKEQASLSRVIVYETPNCSASYPAWES